MQEVCLHEFKAFFCRTLMKRQVSRETNLLFPLRNASWEMENFDNLHPLRVCHVKLSRGAECYLPYERHPELILYFGNVKLFEVWSSYDLNHAQVIKVEPHVVVVGYSPSFISELSFALFIITTKFNSWWAFITCRIFVFNSGKCRNGRCQFVICPTYKSKQTDSFVIDLLEFLSNVLFTKVTSSWLF